MPRVSNATSTGGEKKPGMSMLKPEEDEQSAMAGDDVTVCS